MYQLWHTAMTFVKREKGRAVIDSPLRFYARREPTFSNALAAALPMMVAAVVGLPSSMQTT
jgi:hypothetical protein